MDLKPSPRDANGHVLHGHGTGTFTKRFTSVDTNGVQIFSEVDLKTVTVHEEGTVGKMPFLGSISGSATVYPTDDGFELKRIDIGVPGSVSGWSDSLGTAIDLADYTVRQLITGLTRSGNYIRLTFTAQSGQALVIDNVSIVEQLSDQDGVGTPVEVLFQGSSGFSISAGKSIVSDELVFEVNADKNYLVIMDVGSSGQVNHVLSGGSGYWKKAASNSYDAATLSGSTAVASATANIVNIGISVEPTTIITAYALSGTTDISMWGWR